MSTQSMSPTDAGRLALLDYDWAGAEVAFEAALAEGETAEILDSLGRALYWQGEYSRAIELRQRAFGLMRDGKHYAPAAFVAIRLAFWQALVNGNAAAMSGWVGHARRMVAKAGDCLERGWVELFLANVSDDNDSRIAHAREAMDIGRRFGCVSLEYDTLATLGRIEVDRGELAKGMSMIDEAVTAVAGGLVNDPWAAGEIYCTMFGACEVSGDVRRAESWLEAMGNYVDRTGERPIAAICGMHYGGVLTSAGRWSAAEDELLRALAIYRDTYRGTLFEPLLRLADLRAQQGRLEEAAVLLEGHEERPGAALPRARMLLENGEPEHAVVVLERSLPTKGFSLTDLRALNLMVEIALASGSIESARERVDQLEDLYVAWSLPSVRGCLSRARGRVALAAGAPAPLALFEDSMDAFAQADMDFERAITQLELAKAMADFQQAVAVGEARSALATFERLGAARHVDAAAMVLRDLGDSSRTTGSRRQGVLTRRQLDVLDLLAEGLSNREIADRLFISPRTVEDHVGNILGALHLDNRAQAAAYAHRRPGEN